MLVKDVRTTSKEGAGGAMVIVGARVVESDAKSK